MAFSRTYLVLDVEQAGGKVQHRLRKGQRVSIGQHASNDITVASNAVPRRHTLLSGHNNHFELNLTRKMDGEVVAGGSRLSFRDMRKHGLLPRKGDSYRYPLTEGKSGFVTIGDTRISFNFVKEVIDGDVAAFRGYSWLGATFKQLGRDVPFKVILLALIVLHGFLVKHIAGIPTEHLLQPSNRAVPERLARIIVQRPAVTPADRPIASNQPAGEEAEEEAEDLPRKESRQRKGKGDRPVEKQGVLGLLTGTGTSSQNSNLSDFLLDQGLVKDLDEVMNNASLEVGNGGNSADALDDLDALFAAGEGEDDLADLLGDTGDGIESVSLQKKGRIQLDKIGDMRGSESAVAKRSEDSVRRVLLSNQGRLTYIYNKYLKHRPDLGGKMVVEVSISADGRVAGVNLISSNIGYAEFEQEILRFVRRWSFPSIDEGTVTVAYPLVFNKVN